MTGAASASAPSAAAPWPAGLDLDLLTGAGRLGLAVSGGSDSTALAVLAAEAGVPDLFILTVDHGLRPGSAADADAVEALSARLGLQLERLRVTAAPQGSLQAFARAERYRLLGDAAARHGIAAIVTAHTLDDQAETLLLRLARGSGVRGLAAIRPRSMRDGLVLLRPLLGARRDALRAALTARGIGWREDPSNADPRFDRIAMRNLLPRLAAVGLTPERLAGTAASLRRASESIDVAVAGLAAAAVENDRAGCVRIARASIFEAPEEVRLRLLTEIVRRTGGLAYPPRLDALATVATRVLAGDARATLGRCVVAADGDIVRIWRENRGISSVTVPPGGTALFDGRYTVETAPDAPPMVVAPLGQAARLCPVIAHRPAMVTAPGIFVAGALVAAPTLGVRQRTWRPNWAIVQSAN